MILRKKTKEINIGNIKIGGNAPIAVQSMLNVNSKNIEQNLEQAKKLKEAGCQILRVSIPDFDAIKLIDQIKSNVTIPLVADIHFDYKLAIESIAAGIDKIRINPGNIGNEEKIKKIVAAAKNKNVPIRIGVNSGSLEKEILEKYKQPTPQALCQSVLLNIKLLEKFDFNDIVISLKSSNVEYMTKAYELITEKTNYPLHLGVTEAGTKYNGIIKSSIGIGSLLLKGIGDTIRVSLTADPVEEIEAGFAILKSLNLNNQGIKFISCPTCGRTQINLIKLAKEAEEILKNCQKNLTVAIMGCIVNGPGEGKQADIGIAGGKSCGIIFRKGKVIKKVPEEKLLEELLIQIEKI